MSNQQTNVPDERVDTSVGQVRTKDNPIGIDDIGLPAETRPDHATLPHQVTPDPDKVERQEPQ